MTLLVLSATSVKTMHAFGRTHYEKRGRSRSPESLGIKYLFVYLDPFKRKASGIQ